MFNMTGSSLNRGNLEGKPDNKLGLAFRNLELGILKLSGFFTKKITNRPVRVP